MSGVTGTMAAPGSGLLLAVGTRNRRAPEAPPPLPAVASHPVCDVGVSIPKRRRQAPTLQRDRYDRRGQGNVGDKLRRYSDPVFLCALCVLCGERGEKKEAERGAALRSG